MKRKEKRNLTLEETKARYFPVERSVEDWKKNICYSLQMLKVLQKMNRICVMNTE